MIQTTEYTVHVPIKITSENNGKLALQFADNLVEKINQTMPPDIAEWLEIGDPTVTLEVHRK